MSYERRQYKLSEIGKIVTGKTPKTDIKAYWGLDYPFITPSDFIDTKYINLTSRAISEEGALSVKNNVIEANSVLVTCIGSDMGKSAISVKKSLTNQQINSITVDIEKFDIDFVYYSLSIKKDEIRRMASGSAVPILNKSNFSNIELSCPSLESQKKISNIANILDEKIELLKEENKILEAISQAIFKSWFIDFDPVYANQQGRQCENIDTETAALFPESFEDSELGEIPKGWGVRTVDALLERLKVKSRFDKSQVCEFGDIPVYEQGVNILMGYRNGEPEFKATAEDPIFVFGDHTCITRLSLVPFDISSNVIPAKGRLLPTIWTYYAIKEKQTFQGYRRHWMELIVKKIVTPPENLSKTFANTITPLLMKIQVNRKQISTLSVLRDTILPRIISGQLRIEDAEPIVEEVQ